jgi:hypothetical protein
MDTPNVTENIPLSELFGVSDRLSQLEADIIKFAEAGRLNSMAGLELCENLRHFKASLGYLNQAMEVQNERIRRLEQRS